MCIDVTVKRETNDGNSGAKEERVFLEMQRKELKEMDRWAGSRRISQPTVDVQHLQAGVLKTFEANPALPSF